MVGEKIKNTELGKQAREVDLGGVGGRVNMFKHTGKYSQRTNKNGAYHFQCDGFVH